MKKQYSSRSAFFTPRFLIIFAFCTIGTVLALIAFAVYPGGNALAKQNQNSSPAELPQANVPLLQATHAQPPAEKPAPDVPAVNLPVSGTVDVAALGLMPLPFPLPI